MDTGSGIGHAASEMMKELQKAQQDLQKIDKQHGAGGANFKETMDAHGVSHANRVGETHQVQGASSAKNVLAQAKINANLPSQKVNAVANAERSKWGDMLNDLIGGQDKMNGIMKMALSGRQFSPPELLAMQAGVYRFSQELELTSKVIEKATSGIKQTMNTQV
jgi:hypothetical protein